MMTRRSILKLVSGLTVAVFVAPVRAVVGIARRRPRIHVWTGVAPNTFNDPRNWDTLESPQAGDVLEFRSGHVPAATIPSETEFAEVRIYAGTVKIGTRMEGVRILND